MEQRYHFRSVQFAPLNVRLIEPLVIEVKVELDLQFRAGVVGKGEACHGSNLPNLAIV
jgi:hypothetical protein